MFLSLTLIASLFLPSAQVQTPREYVIREVKPPQIMDSGYKFEWQSGWFSGDSDTNGEADFLLQGRWLPEWSSSLSPINYFDFHAGLDSAASRVFNDRNAAYNISFGLWALLKTPTGFQAIIERTGLGSNAGLVSFDWDTKVEIGIIPPATGFLPPVLDPGKFDSILAAGDQDGDGFEDFFWTNYRGSGTGYSYCGLYSGATLSSIWQWGDGQSGGPMITFYVEPGPLPDLNGDGLADIIIGIPRIDYLTGVESHSYIAFSGPDGNIIWREDALSWMGAYYALGPDLSGDGVADPVFFEKTPLQFRALDGTDGTELWVAPVASLEAQYSGNYVQGLTPWRGFMRNLDHPNLIEYVNYHWVLFGNTAFSAFAHYDAHDGTFLGSFPIPTTLEPWSIDPSWTTDVHGGPFSLGDIDRDGLEEIGLPFKDWQRSPSWAITGSNPSPSSQLAIIGLKTLFVPSAQPFNAGHIDFDIAVPAGVNKDFVILVSTEFDPYGGLELGPWKTFLAPSRVLDYTVGQLPITGTLDANGKGSTYAIIPPHPILIGKTLYSKAVILNPLGSPEQILTMSSMGITELQ